MMIGRKCAECGTYLFSGEAHTVGCSKQWKLIGVMVVSDDNNHRREYETASWYKDSKLDAGEYPVYQREVREGCFVVSSAIVPATIIKEYTPSGFGGHYQDNGDYNEGHRTTERLGKTLYLYNGQQPKPDADFFNTYQSHGFYFRAA